MTLATAQIYFIVSQVDLAIDQKCPRLERFAQEDCLGTCLDQRLAFITC